ncbi:hypothetical protein F4823DRAFT_633865, partial [Ustulina deusta]
GVSQPNQNRYDERSQLYSKLSTWLNEVRIIVAEDVGVFDSDQSEGDENDMAAPSADSQTSRATSVDLSTIVLTKGRGKKATPESLRTRRVAVTEPSGDEWTTRFREYLVERPIKISFQQTEMLQKSIKNFLCKAEAAEHGEDSYGATEKLCNEINEWKASVRLAVITNQEFNNDLEHCKDPSNEAVFQRTVMMSIIDRCHLKTLFDFNCEGLWSLPPASRLPSTNGPKDVITGPKPDLAIFFRFASLVGTDPFSESASIPQELKSCINPDGHTLRCFPFIFVEAQKAFEGIQPAALANMHSASQALFNIWTWMKRAGQDEIFFKDVRVFSIAVNAEQFIVRAHRAKPISNDGEVALVFSYDDLNPKSKFEYTRDQVCTLIHNILIEYAEKKLLGILKSSVVKVLKGHNQELKRKNDAILFGRPSKRLEVAQPQPQAIEPRLVDASASFGMSQFGIHDG